TNTLHGAREACAGNRIVGGCSNNVTFRADDKHIRCEQYDDQTYDDGYAAFHSLSLKIMCALTDCMADKANKALLNSQCAFINAARSRAGTPSMGSLSLQPTPAVSYPVWMCHPRCC